LLGVLLLLVACRSLLEGSLTVRCICWLPSPTLLAGDEDGGPRVTEAMPGPERRELRDDMVRCCCGCSVVSRSLSAMSVIAAVARCAAERRGLEDMMVDVMKGGCCGVVGGVCSLREEEARDDVSD
jgi:hypothetical protein